MGFVFTSEKPSEQGRADCNNGDKDKDEQHVETHPEPPGEEAPCGKGEDDDKQSPSHKRWSWF